MVNQWSIVRVFQFHKNVPQACASSRPLVPSIEFHSVRERGIQVYQARVFSITIVKNIVHDIHRLTRCSSIIYSLFYHFPYKSRITFGVTGKTYIRSVTPLFSYNSWSMICKSYEYSIKFIHRWQKFPLE